MGLRTGGRRAKSLKNRVKSSKIELRFREIRPQSRSSRSAVQQAIIFAMAMSHATSNIKSFVHACMRRSFFIWCHRAKPVTEENRRFFEESKANRWENGSKSPENQGLIVVRNYKSCGWGRERCDRKGHAVFLRPRVDSAIMGSASTGISTSSTKLKKISTFCRRLPPDLSGA